MANAEDGVKSRFWEVRFKSQALLDEKALLAAMAYVDLNPIHAGLAETPETLEFTSIQERALGLTSDDPNNEKTSPCVPESAKIDIEVLREKSEIAIMARADLMPFDATGRAKWAIPFAFDDYLELVDWTGRAIHPSKRGHIPSGYPKILDRLGIDGKQFITHANRLLIAFGSAIGAPDALVNLCARRQSKYLRGMSIAKAVFTSKQAA